MLKRNERIILKVGDAIVFDAYHYQKNSTSKNKRKQEEGIFINDGCQCVYRLVAVDGNGNGDDGEKHKDKDKHKGALELVEKEEEFTHVKRRIKIIDDDGQQNEEDKVGVLQEWGRKGKVPAGKEVKTVRKSSRAIRKCAVGAGEGVTKMASPLVPSAKEETNVKMKTRSRGLLENDDAMADYDLVPSPGMKTVGVRVLVEDQVEVEALEAYVIVNAQQANVQIPEVGDKVRMVFSQQDLFVGKHTMWFIGTITSVANMKKKGTTATTCTYNLKIAWGDNSEDEHVYPHPNDEMEILSPEILIGCPSVYYSKSTETVSSPIAFDLSPKFLKVGDHVQCLYQDGLSGGQWWPGRVAAINIDEDCADIAYLDGEVRRTASSNRR